MMSQSRSHSVIQYQRPTNADKRRKPKQTIEEQPIILPKAYSMNAMAHSHPHPKADKTRPMINCSVSDSFMLCEDVDGMQTPDLMDDDYSVCSVGDLDVVDEVEEEPISAPQLKFDRSVTVGKSK